MLASAPADKSPMSQNPRTRSPLARRLRLALASMLLPVAAVAAAGLVTFRLSVSALEEFRQETVEESRLIEEVRDLLVKADDLGEASAEEDDPAATARFVAHGALIDRRFDELQTLATQPERELAAKADAAWTQSTADLQAAKARPRDQVTDDRLDPFHDHVDEAASILADLHSLNGNQVADEIASLRRREQDQLLAGLAALLVGSTAALLLARRLGRSLTQPVSVSTSAPQLPFGIRVKLAWRRITGKAPRPTKPDRKSVVQKLRSAMQTSPPSKCSSKSPNNDRSCA